MQKQIAPSDLRALAQQLLRVGKMPDVNTLLGVISGVRQKYAPQIKAAQSKGAEADDKILDPLVKAVTPSPDEFASGGEESPIPPTGDLTPPASEMQPKSLLLGRKGGVAAPPPGRGSASSFAPTQGPTTKLPGKI
jgi:hypothetical protein